MADVTLILHAIERGDADATAKLLPVVYYELRRIARQQMQQERKDHTLQATALVHEAYLRLLGDVPVACASRGRFFAAAAESMRRILIEHARRKLALRHGGERPRVPLEEELPIATACKSPEELLDLSDALDRLAIEDPEKAELVKLVFFAGLSLEEAAATLHIASATAYRHWSFTRAWLHRAVRGQARAEPAA